MTFDPYVGMQFSGEGEDMIATVEIQPHHCNPTGNVNGGVILSLADNLATGTPAAPTPPRPARGASWSASTCMR